MKVSQDVSVGNSCVKALFGQWLSDSVSRPAFDNRSPKLLVVEVYAGLSCGRSGSSVEGAEASGETAR